MNNLLDKISGHSERLASTLTRARVSEYLRAGNSPDAFANHLSSRERALVRETRALLLGDGFTQLVDSGHLTFGILRPHLERGKKIGSDSELAVAITEEIQQRGRFRIVLNLPWPVSIGAFTEFYQDVKDRKQRVKKLTTDGRMSNVWDIIAENGTSGASSFLLLEALDLQRETGLPAWQLWRKFIGERKPESALPGTLRREYGTEDYNIVHGSDSLAAVYTDVQWMARQLPTHS